jgi:DNA-binding FrmR family transcriptional regulator
MTSVVHLHEATRHDLLMRLKRIEGQAHGIGRMIEQGRDCEDILCELAALRSATQAASLTLLEQYTVYGLRQAPDAPSLEQAVAHLIGVIELSTR